MNNTLACNKYYKLSRQEEANNEDPEGNWQQRKVRTSDQNSNDNLQEESAPPSRSCDDSSLPSNKDDKTDQNHKTVDAEARVDAAELMSKDNDRTLREFVIDITAFAIGRKTLRDFVSKETLSLLKSSSTPQPSISELCVEFNKIIKNVGQDFEEKFNVGKCGTNIDEPSIVFGMHKRKKNIDKEVNRLLSRERYQDCDPFFLLELYFALFCNIFNRLLSFYFNFKADEKIGVQEKNEMISYHLYNISIFYYGISDPEKFNKFDKKATNIIGQCISECISNIDSNNICLCFFSLFPPNAMRLASPDYDHTRVSTVKKTGLALGHAFAIANRLTSLEGRGNFIAKIFILQKLSTLYYHHSELLNIINHQDLKGENFNPADILRLTVKANEPFVHQQHELIKQVIRSSSKLNSATQQTTQINPYSHYILRYRYIIENLEKVNLTLKPCNAEIEFSQMIEFLVLFAENAIIVTRRYKSKSNVNHMHTAIFCINLVLNLINALPLMTFYDSGRSETGADFKYLFCLMNCSAIIAAHANRDAAINYFSRLSLFIEDDELSSIRKYLKMAFVRINENKDLLTDDKLFDCFKKSIVEAARAGDHYAREIYFFGLINHKSLCDFKFLPDGLSLPSVAMKVITYNSSLENRDYGELLCIQRASEIPRMLSVCRMESTKTTRVPLKTLLMDTLWHYEKGEKDDGFDKKIKTRMKTKSPEDQFCLGVIIYLSKGGEDAMHYLDNIEESEKIYWLKGWIYQQQNLFDEAIAKFSEITDSTYDFVNLAECYLSSAMEDDLSEIDEGDNELALKVQKKLKASIDYFNRKIEFYKTYSMDTFDEQVTLRKKLTYAEYELKTVDYIIEINKISTPYENLSKTAEAEGNISQAHVFSGKRKSSRPASIASKEAPPHNTTKASSAVSVNSADKTKAMIYEAQRISGQTIIATEQMPNHSCSLQQHIKSQLRKIFKKYMVSDTVSGKPMLIRHPFLDECFFRTRGKIFSHGERHNYKKINPLIKSINVKLNELELTKDKYDNLEQKFNIIINALLISNNAFFIGQNTLLDRLGWLLVENVDELLKEDLSESSVKEVSRYAMLIFLISISNCMSMDVHFEFSKRDFCGDDTNLLVSELRAYIQKVEGEYPEEEYGVIYQLKLRISCRLANLYHALRAIYPSQKYIAKPLMTLRDEIIPEKRKHEKEARKAAAVMAPYTPKLKILADTD